MPSERFNLVFSGDLARGADLAQAKKNLGRLFKISDEKVEALFSGKAITLKKNLIHWVITMMTHRRFLRLKSLKRQNRQILI